MAPSPAERQIILLSASTAARRRDTTRQFQKLIVECNWMQLTETLRWRRLLPALGPRIVELAGGAVSSAFAGSVEQALEAGRRQGAFLELIGSRIMAELSGSGIRSEPLKGPSLGEAIYGDVGRRLSTDIDLLVAPEQLQASVEVLRGLGYEAPRDHVDGSGLPLLHFALLHEQSELPPVELHWRIHWYERCFACERLLRPAAYASTDWHPALADELGALLLFYARDGFIDLRLAADLSAWWDACGADLPDGALDELLLAFPALARPILTAARVAEQVVGLPATRLFGNIPELDLRTRMVMRLANPHPNSSRSQLYADIGLIDGLLTPRGGYGAFVRRQIFPPREVLEQQARHGARKRRRSSLGRGTGVLARYGLTMTRLVRSPETLR